MKTRFAKFHNIPELMSLFREIADIQTAEVLNLPVPKKEEHHIAVEPSKLQKEMVTDLGDRADLIRQGEVPNHIDNMLKITNEGRKLALDQRLVNDMLPDNENSKVNACVNNVFEFWENTKANKSTQLIFCDLSVPVKSNNIIMKQLEDGTFEMDKEETERVNAEESKFTDVYNDIKKKLIEKGIPAEEIQFIHDANTETKKEDLFDRVRTGEVRVLLGSTFKMGSGTNVQDKIIALHNLDCPWKSSDLIQRIGRAVRQGNENELVHIFNYVTKGTFDAYMYQLVQQKQEFTSQIMTSKSPIRSMEDIDERALNYAEIKALATGNEYIKEKTELEAKATKLRVLKQSYLNQKYDLEEMTEHKYPQQIKEYETRIENLKEDQEHLKSNTIGNSDNFSVMTLDNQVYNEKVKAGEKILELCKKVEDTASLYIGEYRGFKMYLEFNTFEKTFQVALKNKQTYRATLGNDKIGAITRINNALENMSKMIENNIEQLQNIENQYKIAKQNLSIPFAQEEELKKCLERLKEVNTLLKIGGKEDKEIVDLDDETEEIQEDEYIKQRKKEYVR